MKLLLVAMLLLTSSCSFFEKAKGPVVEKASSTARELSVKHLGCSTGDAVFSDVEKQMKKMLKVKSKSLKSIGGTLCILSVGPVIKELVDVGNKQLPESWIDDGCTLEGFSGDASDLANKLCDKL